MFMTLHWHHNERDGVSNYQPHDCLLNRLFRLRAKKTSKFRVTGLCVGNSPGPVNSPHKGPVTRKMFPFDDVIMKHHGVYMFLTRTIPLHLMPTIWGAVVSLMINSPLVVNGRLRNLNCKLTSENCRQHSSCFKHFALMNVTRTSD